MFVSRIHVVLNVNGTFSSLTHLPLLRSLLSAAPIYSHIVILLMTTDHLFPSAAQYCSTKSYPSILESSHLLRFSHPIPTGNTSLPFLDQCSFLLLLIFVLDLKITSQTSPGTLLARNSAAGEAMPLTEIMSPFALRARALEGPMPV